MEDTLSLLTEPTIDDISKQMNVSSNKSVGQLAVLEGTVWLREYSYLRRAHTARNCICIPTKSKFYNIYVCHILNNYKIIAAVLIELLEKMI